MATGTFSVTILLLFSYSLLSTVRGSNKLTDTCFENCMKLLREASEVADNEPCHERPTGEFPEENHSCRENCKNVSFSSGKDTGWSGTQTFVQATTSPLLYNSGYNSITLKWNTSEDVHRSIAFYILQIQPNIQSLQRPLELPPSIPRYIMIKETVRNPQLLMVENLVNGFDYRFRVAAVGLNGTSSEYSDWSPFYSTSDNCNRTTGSITTISFVPFFRRSTINVDFPCPVREVTLNVSIKAKNKNPVVLDASLNWKNPPRINQLKDVIVRVTVKLLKHRDGSIDARCAHYHNADFKKTFIIHTNKTSLDLSSKKSSSSSVSNGEKNSIHFGCSYEVKFEVSGFSQNSFESTTTFKIPECLLNVSSCPVPNPQGTESGVIDEKIFLNGNGNSTHAANISWNAQRWFESHQIEFFDVLIEERPDTSRYYYIFDVPARDKVNHYHVVSYNMTEGRTYRVQVRAFHGLNCLHDVLGQKFFTIMKPCPHGCTENATCFPIGLFDGTARCKCKDGYSGNGTLCEAIIEPPEPLSSSPETNINVLAIVLPLVFVIVVVAIIFSLIYLRIKKKKQLVLDAFQEHGLAISPSSSNTNLYQHCPPRHNVEETSAKDNDIELYEKEVNVIYVPQEIQDAISGGLTDGYEFNADLIKFEECLGKGAFGYVHRAKALGITAEPEWTTVAVKTLSEPVTEKSVEDFIAEIELMKRIGDHENIIRMLGCCTVTLPICLIMEYAPYGNLLVYLRAAKSKLLENDSAMKTTTHQQQELTDSSFVNENPAEEKQPIPETLFPEENNFSDTKPSTSHAQTILDSDTYLESFAFQIAKGMAYVAGQGIVHRDLAARNILIGKDYQLKISDFGLSKEGVYVKSTSGKIPLRWLSIEAIRERIYSSASDVWSYGIVLWEICTLGDFPYPTLSDRELLKYLLSGERLEKPSNCSNEIYAMMLQCWQSDPEDRPTFAHLRNILWKMNTGESPYINIDPMPENQATQADQDGSIENSMMV